MIYEVAAAWSVHWTCATAATASRRSTPTPSPTVRRPVLGPGTGTKLELTTAPAGWDGAEESIAYYRGDITLTTKDSTYDLEVSETFIEGMVGNTVTVTTDIENNGPAGGPDLNPESDSYLVRAQLPEGTELVRVDSDGAAHGNATTPTSSLRVYAATTTALERFDFACALDKFGFGARPDITYTVKITDTTAFQGAVEIGAVYTTAISKATPKATSHSSTTTPTRPVTTTTRTTTRTSS